MLMQIWTDFYLHQEARPRGFAKKTPKYQHFPSLNGKLTTSADSVISVSLFLGPHSNLRLKNIPLVELGEIYSAFLSTSKHNVFGSSKDTSLQYWYCTQIKWILNCYFVDPEMLILMNYWRN